MAFDDKARDGRSSRLCAVVLAGALGLSLLLGGVPWMVAGLHLGPQDSTMREIADGDRVDRAVIDRTLESRRAALEWVDRGRSHSEIGALYLLKASRAEAGGAERTSFIDAAIRAQTAALVRAPVDSYGWLRLAQGVTARPAVAGSREEAGPTPPQILGLALRLAPFEPALMVPRIDLALLRWRSLDTALQNRMAEQIRLAAQWKPTALARSARDRFALPVVIGVLAPQPGLMRRFTYAYSRL